jgi:hypothetical protein
MEGTLGVSAWHKSGQMAGQRNLRPHSWDFRKSVFQYFFIPVKSPPHTKSHEKNGELLLQRSPQDPALLAACRSLRRSLDFHSTHILSV